LDRKNRTTTHIRQQGFSIEQDEIQQMLNKLRTQVKKDDYCVFSGSLPLNCPQDLYNHLILTCKKNFARCVLDTSGVPLQEGIKARPYIIKPNLEELAFLLDDASLLNLDFIRPRYDIEILRQKVLNLINEEISHLLITLGENGALCISKSKTLYGNVRIEDAINTIGSGDSFLGGFLYGVSQNEELQTSFRYAIACGAANCLKKEPGFFELKDVSNLLSRVKIIEI
jgi:1-phosphofructokinase family hexose kinase